MAVRGPDPTVSDSEIISAIESTDCPFATAKDVAEIVGLSRERARQRLNRLSEQGAIEREKTSGVVIYWLSDD
ncbi:winged helix-turn-helix transcriptional regulator [Halovenus marina]|uniref:winged helix-turn-helix transcriptional regulator n=1 Tax=Halovenus marina TaxID=3396621 RepID=UPI003F568153